MTQKKNFDCLRMKRDAQRKLLLESSEFGEHEARRRQLERLMKDPILGPLAARMRLALKKNGRQTEHPPAA